MEEIAQTAVELASEIETIQGVKKAFFRRFWLVSGWETVRAIAAAQLEAVTIFALKALWVYDL